MSFLFVVFPTSWRGARWRFFEPGGRPGPGLPGFGAPAGQQTFARMFRNPRRTRAGVSRPGVAVTVTVVGRELAIQVGRFDPQAAAGRLRVNRLSGTAAVAVYVAGEGGPGGTGERWVAGLYPAAPGAAEPLLLCDRCFEAATGLHAVCEDGCPLDLDHEGLCLRDGPDECQLCGAQDRLHEVERVNVDRCLPTVGEDGEGMWFLHRRRARPFPSAQAAWDYWHANGDDGRSARLLPGSAEPVSASTAKGTPMAVLESPDYRAARERLQGNPVISMMAAGVVTVPLAELADEDGTPRSHLMKQANGGFDDAEARNAGNPDYEPYPKDAHRHLGLIAEAILAERAAMRAAVASAMAPPGTDPESGSLSSRHVERKAVAPSVRSFQLERAGGRAGLGPVGCVHAGRG